MPFIFIDQGAAAIKHYQPPKSPLLKRAEKSASTQKVEGKDPSNQQRHSAYQQHHNTSHQVHTAQEIMMSPVIYLEQSQASIKAAWDLMQNNKIKHLPITKNKKLIGIVSERDILKIYALKNANENNWYRTKVFAASGSMDIHQLSQVLFDECIGSLPIVNEEQEIIGMITRSDILKLSSQYGPMEFWA
jgi:acetoin utilization protein AcuB